MSHPNIVPVLAAMLIFALAIMQLVEAGKPRSRNTCPGSARPTKRHPPGSPCETCSSIMCLNEIFQFAALLVA